MTAGATRDQLFVSYSHRDEDALAEFLTMLAPVEQAGSLVRWSDRDIRPGEDWNERILAAIARAKVVLMLVNGAFLESAFIRNVELPRILHGHLERGLRLYWVLLEPALVEWSPLASVQAAHPIRISLAEIKDRSDRLKAIADICRRIGADLGQYSSVDRKSRSTLMDQLTDYLKPDYELTKEIDAGDFSFVYAGVRTADRRPVAVKAIVTSSLQTWAVEKLQSQVEKARLLADPAFIRIHEARLEPDKPRVVASELVDGPTLQDVLRASGSMPAERVAIILRRIASALREAHQVGLGCGSLRPANIFLLDGDVVKLSPVNLSNEVACSERMRGRFVTSSEMLTYMIPELYEGGCLSPEADQYYLGLLGLELLGGAPPVRITCLADLQQKQRFFDGPRAWFGPWQHAEPGLARIIARALRRRPEDRWPGMEDVVRLLGAVGPGGGWEDPIEGLVKPSYQRYCAGRPELYRGFYRRYFERSPQTRDYFKKTGMRQQCRMLDDAVALLANFRAGPEPTALSRTARSHAKLGLEEKHYRDFGEAFVATLRAVGEDDEDAISAWRHLFERGTRYMLQFAGASSESSQHIA